MKHDTSMMLPKAKDLKCFVECDSCKVEDVI